MRSIRASDVAKALVGEHWIGRREQGYHNKAMDTGTERESEARAAYAFACDEPVTQVGFVYMDEQRLWTYKDVSAYLCISWKTVRRWAGEKKIPVIKVGSQNRFKPSEIRKWAEDNR